MFFRLDGISVILINQGPTSLPLGSPEGALLARVGFEPTSSRGH